MWFKNLCFYRFTEPFTLSAESLAEKLAAMSFKPCGPHEEVSLGWVAPLASAPEALVHPTNGFLMVCLKKQEKVLPASVVNELLQENIVEEEQESGRKLGRKARVQMKDELVFSLLPKAFSFSKRNYAYIDPHGGWLVVDSASPNKAEDLLFLLRKSMGSLPVVLPKTTDSPTQTMTQWLLGKALPANITIEDECELQAQGEDGGVIRCKRQDLSLPEIQNHLNSGKEVTKLAVSWANRLGFVIDKTLMIKRLRFLDLVQDQLRETDIEDDATRFDVEFAIMAAEFSTLLPELMTCFGSVE